MNGLFRTLALTVAAFGMFACDQMDKPAAPSPYSEATGSARIRLPTLPIGFLADSSLDSNGAMVFQLTVTGPGMPPIHAAWNLNPGQPEKVLLTDIPVGSPRVFSGRLIWVAAGGDSSVTHEGSDSVEIYRDRVAEVALYLRKKGSTGSAEVCVEVEGWPSDSTCIKRPTLPITDVAGCWQVIIRRFTSTHDTILRIGRMRITQRDSALTGTITWASGQVEYAMGKYYPVTTGLVKFGHEVVGDYYLKAYFDSNGVGLQGEYRDTAGIFAGGLHMIRIGCDTTSVPPEDTTVVAPLDSTLDCYRTAQSFDSASRGLQNGLMLLKNNGKTRGRWGWIKWDGYPIMYVTGTIIPDPVDAQRINFNGFAPAGMADSSIQEERFFYQGTYDPTKKMTIGGDFFRQGDLRNRLGIWKASPVACRAQDSLSQ